MPARLSSRFLRRAFTSTPRTRTAIPSRFAFNEFPQGMSSSPKVGKIERWYLPTMALIAAGMIYLLSSPLSRLLGAYTTSPTATSVSHPLDLANRQIGFAIANALEDHNVPASSLTQELRNSMLLDAYGARSTLEEMGRALEFKEPVMSEQERRRALLEAYGDRSSLKSMEKTMELYEVQ